MNDESDLRQRLIDLRTSMGFTQTAFAPMCGMPLRTLQDIEAGRNPVRPIHIKAAQAAVLFASIDPALAKSLPADLKEAVMMIADNVRT